MSPVLPTGKVDLKFNFIKTGMLKGTGELYMNGKKVAEGAIEKTIPGGFSLSETFDVGVDNGTPVSNNYKSKDHFPFTGQIDKVTINLTGEDTDKAKELINPGVRLMLVELSVGDTHQRREMEEGVPPLGSKVRACPVSAIPDGCRRRFSLRAAIASASRPADCGPTA